MPGAKSGRVGLKDLHYALITSDTSAGITYATPVAFAGAMTAKITSQNDQATQYDDDGASEVAFARGKVTVEIKVRDLDVDTQAVLAGHTVTNGVQIENADDVPPYVAIGFRSIKANGKYRYVWLLKGQFVEADDDFETRGEKIAFQNSTLKGTFLKTEYNGNVEVKTDEDMTGFVPATATGWFTSVVYKAPAA